ncbi:hypothetical protein WA026_001300 [Henosepilachna vigintioctopunctata]|uniref:Uncharacterized protein n=1 Tax=Henosepilachna vigintioctopunctata TaxID=420089 RepID=A0AAW1UT20_9CUCU
MEQNKNQQNLIDISSLIMQWLLKREQDGYRISFGYVSSEAQIDISEIIYGYRSVAIIPCDVLLTEDTLQNKADVTAGSSGLLNSKFIGDMMDESSFFAEQLYI